MPLFALIRARLEMGEISVKTHGILQFYFYTGTSAVQAHKKIHIST